MSDQELVDLLGVIKELRDERSLPEPYQPPTSCLGPREAHCHVRIIAGACQGNSI